MLVRVFVLLLAASVLGGCSMVTSDQPLFTEADQKGAPVLRPGLWALPNSDCQYDEKSPAKGWPKCANATVVTADRLAGGERGPSGETKGSLAYRLAAGDPPSLQIAAPEDEPDGPKFIYAGLRATAFDNQGRATAARVWLALCSKPPKFEDAKLPDLSPKTPQNLPKGLEPRAGGVCTAKTAEAAMAAVKRSEGWLVSGGAEDFYLSAHWVRDGDD
jgi:hypothetical protein